MKNKFMKALHLAVIVAMLFTSVALADNVENDIVTDPASITLLAGVGSSYVDVQFYVQAQGIGADGDAGCNFDSTSEKVTFTINTPSDVTADPASLTFNKCHDGSNFNYQTVRFSANAGATSGNISFTQTFNNSGGTFNYGNAVIFVNVTNPNTAPSVSVTGVTDGANYNKGSVPSAMCSVTDAEDSNSSFAATLSAISGPYASDGIGSQTASCSYIDGGGLTANASVTYNIVDPTAPSITYVLNPSAPDGSNDWYKSDVTLTWTVSEPEAPNSLIKTGCVDQNITADQLPVTYSCSATSAGGSGGELSVTIKSDGTAPIITASRTPGANANDWNNTDVTASYEASDATPGLDGSSPATGSFTFSSEGAGQSHTFTVGDNAGNSASATVDNVNIDKTAPSISFVGPSTSVWYNADVTANWSCSDALSGEVSASVSATTSGEGSAIAVTGTCTDKAGNTASDTQYFMVDNTPPVVAVTGVADGAQYILGSVPAAGCSTTDALSGVATYASLSSVGGPVGFITLTCSGALDNAGNAGNIANATYQVIYNWNGFFQPIDNNMLNVVKAGSGIPVKFSLSGNQGLNIFAAGYPKSTTVACGTSAEDAIETTVTAGGSSLSYDALADHYIYVWKTEKSWAGTCRTLVVKLVDGTYHYANFKFK